MRGVPATTIHRIIYTPVYDPEYEKIAEWLADNGERPDIEGLTDEALDRAAEFYKLHKSIPGALAAAGLRGSDFITGWKRRDDPLDIGFIDESSMLDDKQFDDLKEIFSTLVLFGDPAQLAPVNQSGAMVFDKLPAPAVYNLERIHRQDADNPILDLAHALADPQLEFHDFERMVEDTARKDDRVQFAQRVEVDLMARSPVLVWRNATRIRLINAFRMVHDAPEDELLEGEPLICDGIELPMKHRKKRLDLEARGLIKGAQVIYLGPGRKPGISRLSGVGGGGTAGAGGAAVCSLGRGGARFVGPSAWHVRRGGCGNVLERAAGAAKRGEAGRHGRVSFTQRVAPTDEIHPARRGAGRSLVEPDRHRSCLWRARHGKCHCRLECFLVRGAETGSHRSHHPVFSQGNRGGVGGSHLARMGAGGVRRGLPGSISVCGGPSLRHRSCACPCSCRQGRDGGRQVPLDQPPFRDQL